MLLSNRPTVTKLVLPWETNRMNERNSEISSKISFSSFSFYVFDLSFTLFFHSYSFVRYIFSSFSLFSPHFDVRFFWFADEFYLWAEAIFHFFLIYRLHSIELGIFYNFKQIENLWQPCVEKKGAMPFFQSDLFSILIIGKS